jgi:ATP-dependent RNA helicase DeaD
LIHLLKTGEAAKSAPKTENYDRPQRDERPGGFDRGQRDDRRPRFEDRRDDRRSERPWRFEDRPPRRAEPMRPAKAAPWKTDAARKPKVVIPPPGYKPAPAKPAVEKTIEKSVEAKVEPVKTFSDEEILASVKSPEPKAESKLFVKPKTVTAAPKSKPSRATPGGQTRLWMSVGETQDVTPIDIVNAVAGETGLPGKVVGTVDVREKHLFVDVASEHANGIIAKLNRANIKGHKVKVKVA